MSDVVVVVGGTYTRADGGGAGYGLGAGGGTGAGRGAGRGRARRGAGAGAVDGGTGAAFRRDIGEYSSPVGDRDDGGSSRRFLLAPAGRAGTASRTVVMMPTAAPSHTRLRMETSNQPPPLNGNVT
jgi:hypothetical protein